MDSTVNNINDGPRCGLQYTDINGDAKRDLLIGNYAGGLSFYSSRAPIGINEFHVAADNITVYPNPAGRDLYIRASANLITEMNVEVIDVVGKVCITESNQSSLIRMDCSDLGPGIYFLRIFIRSGKESSTVIKKIVIGQ